MTLDPTNGTASGAAVQTSADDTTAGRLMRADYGYGPGNVVGAVSENAGMPTGAVIERGTTPDGDYVRFADGTQICTATLAAVSCTNAEGALFASGTTNWDFPVAFASGTSISVSGNGGAMGRFASFDAPTDSHVTCKVLSTVNDSALQSPAAVAVGRWF